jgi:pimeloyl-ACP methyl ester carboxylesterase
MNLNDLKLDTKQLSAAKDALHRVAAQWNETVNETALRLESRVVDHAVPLADAIDAERKTLRTRAGQAISYYVDRRAHGRPIVLLHSVNAAASAYEVRPLFQHYREQRPVYAVDLPGFGFSERDERPYTPHLFAAAIEDVLRRVKSQHHDEAADVVALSLTGELAAIASLEASGLVHSLALLSPTGLGTEAKVPLPLVQRVLSAPPVGQLLFDVIASRPSVAFFLGLSFGGKVDQGLKQYAYATSHQPGARFAPLAFLTNALFTPNVRDEVYAKVTVPTLVIHDDAAYARFDGLADLLKKNANVRATRFTRTRGLPHFEQLAATAKALDEFWTSAERERSHAHHAHA